MHVRATHAARACDACRFFFKDILSTHSQRRCTSATVTIVLNLVHIVTTCSPSPDPIKSQKLYFPGSITMRIVWWLIGVKKLAEEATISTSTACRRSNPSVSLDNP